MSLFNIVSHSTITTQGIQTHDETKSMHQLALTLHNVYQLDTMHVSVRDRSCRQSLALIGDRLIFLPSVLW